MWNEDGAKKMSRVCPAIRRRTAPSRWWDLARKFYGKSPGDRALLLEAVCTLGLARLTILFVPFRRIAPVLGKTMAETSRDDREHMVVAAGVSYAVETVARHTPWDSKCLARALAAKVMLRRRGVRSTLYLGLGKDGMGGLLAHAWLRYGETIVTGGTRRPESCRSRHFCRVPVVTGAPRQTTRRRCAGEHGGKDYK